VKLLRKTSAVTLTPQRSAADSAREPGGESHRGQILVIFAGVFVVLLLMCALVVDLAWLWNNSLRIQRTADAAALAGVVYLPNDVPNAKGAAWKEATRNGYPDATAGITVTPTQDSVNLRRLSVKVTAPVQTFFLGVIGMNTVIISRRANAEFVLPVPMGSPLNYYGVGCLDTNTVAPDATGEPACTTGGNSNGLSGVPNAVAGSNLTGAGAPSQLNSQGFWGAVFTKGGDSRNGDAYSPTNFSGGGGGGPGANSEYDPAGYGYGVDVPAGGGGQVYVFDAVHCGMPTLGSGRAGSGDEWTGNLGGSNPAPVTTYYNLWNTNNTPFNFGDDTLVYASGSLFERGINDSNASYVDQSGAHGTGAPQYTANGTTIRRCDQAAGVGSEAYPYHLKWWQIPVTLAAGSYRLQITTTNVTLPPVGSSGFGGGTQPEASQPSANVGAANRFSLEVTSFGPNARVYGAGRMAAYTNMQAGTQSFYLAQIDAAAGRGKTLEIDLYDPGDVGGGAWLQVLNPDGGTYSPATFSFTSVSKAGTVGPSGTNVTCIETNRPGSAPGFAVPAGCPTIYDGSGSQFDSYWLRILIPLPATYGNAGLQPSGTPAPGWWKIQYSVGGGNDTTTWTVSIRGNPVHLIEP
jgi:Flp pilus assembly protein TadG